MTTTTLNILSKEKIFEVIIDVEDLERVLTFGRWHIDPPSGRNNTYYVRANHKKGKSISLHRFILNAPEGIEVDHRDGNGLNNSKANLRLATKSQNKQNRGLQANNTSGVKGVTWHKIRQKWYVQIKVQGEAIYVGSFISKEEAYEAYVKASELYHDKDFKRLV